MSGSTGAAIGLVGWDAVTGLGRYNDDLARHCGAVRRLLPAHPTLPPAAATPPGGIRIPRGEPEDATLDEFLNGLDWLLFVETPYILRLPERARRAGVRLAAIPMAENFDPRAPWVGLIDLMLPPTRHCTALLERARREYGFAWRVAYVPGAVDTERLPFRPRAVCESFLFCNGRGGYAGRKGAAAIAAAARLAPEVRLIVRSQVAELPPMPPHVEVRPEAADPAELYRDGDVAVQPSRWEGLGLTLLEAQACGLPLVTTDGPPMAEYRPHRLVAANPGTILIGGREVATFDVAPAALAATLRALRRTDVAEAGIAARRFIEAEHSWRVVAPRLRRMLEREDPVSRSRAAAEGRQPKTIRGPPRHSTRPGPLSPNWSLRRPQRFCTSAAAPAAEGRP